MAPASATHSIIEGNLVVAISNHLRARGSGCRVAPEAPVRPALGKATNARAPDVAVTCAPVTTTKTLDEPVLIVELLSPGNQDDTWESIRALAPLPSLKEIVVVQSEDVGVEVYTKGVDVGWPDEPEAVSSGALRLASVDLDLQIAEVYRGTHLGT
jgi:Uma2 family endonuclease